MKNHDHKCEDFTSFTSKNVDVVVSNNVHGTGQSKSVMFVFGENLMTTVEIIGKNVMQNDPIHVVGMRFKTSNEKAFTEIPTYWRKFYTEGIFEKIPNKISF